MKGHGAGPDRDRVFRVTAAVPGPDLVSDREDHVQIVSNAHDEVRVRVWMRLAGSESWRENDMTRRTVTAEAQESGSEGSPWLGNLIVKISGPLVTAKDQPPAPGSNCILRAIWWGRRAGGWVLERLPSSTAPWSQLLRLTVVVFTWILTIFIVFYAVLLWVFLIAPIVWLAGRSGKKKQTAPLPPPPPPAGWSPMPASATPVLPQPANSLSSLLEALERAPDPDPQPAMDSCPMCGGKTLPDVTACGFCGVHLPMVVSRGWHTDPLGGTDRRWFDGERWTEFTRGRAA